LTFFRKNYCTVKPEQGWSPQLYFQLQLTLLIIGEKDLVLSDRSMDGSTAAEKLEQEGYRQINVLQGGFEAWRSAGKTLEREAADEPDDPRTLLQLEDRSYRVDTDQSIIEWTGRNPNTTHF
jgi:hypothetical protein